MKFLQTAPAQVWLLFAAIFLFSFSVPAQEGEPVVIDEVVAQVNDGVITLSRVKREMKIAAESVAQQERKSLEDATREIEGKRPEIIASLINEELLLQQGKELGIERDVEVEVNARFLAIMKEQQVKSLEELYKRMREQQIDPEEIKSLWRKEFTKQFVLRNAVDSKVYYAPSAKDVEDYFNKNKEKFRKPESITLSQIFLSFAGRAEADVKAKANDLIRQIRGGANFTELVAQHSEDAKTKADNGKVGTFEVRALNQLIADAVKNVKAGGVTDPVVVDEGVMILRVDERLADSATPVFEERRVREAMLEEKRPAERKKYMDNLRSEAYIKINESYRASVLPFLSKNDPPN